MDEEDDKPKLDYRQIESLEEHGKKFAGIRQQSNKTNLLT